MRIKDENEQSLEKKQLQKWAIDDVLRNCLLIVRDDLRSDVPKPNSRQQAIEKYLDDKDFK